MIEADMPVPPSKKKKRFPVFRKFIEIAIESANDSRYAKISYRMVLAEALWNIYFVVPALLGFNAPGNVNVILGLDVQIIGVMVMTAIVLSNGYLLIKENKQKDTTRKTLYEIEHGYAEGEYNPISPLDDGRGNSVFGNKWQCYRCGISFINANTLSTHISLHHGGKK